MNTTERANINGFVSSKDINGRTDYYKLLEAARTGRINKVKRGVYATDDALANTMIDTEKIVPGGVLCLYSAWSYYNLSTQIPSAYCIAIKHGRKIVVPDFPPIDLYHWSGNALNLGITEANIAGFTVKIYDIEKSVCDAVRYRNKVGMDVCIEVIKEYLKRKNRNIDKLARYANALRVGNIIRPMVEMELQ